MVKTYNTNYKLSTRLCFTYGLVFFLLAAISGCKNHDSKIELIWKNDRAVGIAIPKDLVHSPLSGIRLDRFIHVLLPGKKPTDEDILGDYDTDGDNLLFKPAIPLTAGLRYNIFEHDRLIGFVQVPANKGSAPVVVAIYPDADTIPENTLKFYLKFSKPMQTGHALSYITLLDKNKDTMRRVFLDLQPELWDTSGTVLTVWLDPGRIKRGLVLNHQLGNPLKKAGKYQLVISNMWKDTRGIPLAKAYTRQFWVGKRDEKQPDMNSWHIQTPRSGTMDPLVIDTQKPLDHYLLQECISVVDDAGRPVDGNIALSKRGHLFTFTPLHNWLNKPYRIRVAAKLEDLAGNNLNRVFDRDITKDKQANKDFYERGFAVK